MASKICWSGWVILSMILHKIMLSDHHHRLYLPERGPSIYWKLQYLARNKLLPSHKDFDTDMPNTMMKVLLQIKDDELWAKYIKSVLNRGTLAKSPLGCILRDSALFWTLFELFCYPHFQSQGKQNTRLSVCHIVMWYPIISGVSVFYWLHD